MAGKALIHLTCVTIDGHGVLIEGPSGAGKSDLALRLIDRGAKLVSDDYIELVESDGKLLARSPATIAGRMEVRGLGIVPLPHLAEIEPALLVVLGEERERMPEPAFRALLGVDLPTVIIDPRFASAPIKVELAMRHVAGIGA